MKKQLLDIFSKEPIKKSNVEKRPIVIDHREKNSLVPSELMKLGFIPEYKQLLLGDYHIGKTIIERKTLQDLQGSIINKRIFSQLKDLNPKNSLLIIEGTIADNKLTIHENALKGFLLSLATEYKIPFIFTENEAETAMYIYILAKKTKKNISLRQTRSSLSKTEQQQFILEGFPGIGPKAAQTLIEEFQSLSKIFKAPLAKIEKLLGARAKDFKELLD
jgi:ERCC4-type nuclease